MALDVSIASGATTYKLKATQLRVLYDKSPIQFGIPGGVNPIVFDLGQFIGSVSVEGIVDMTATSDGGVTVPSKNDLEDFVIDTWNADTTLTYTEDENGDGTAETQTYGTARIKSLMCFKLAGQEDRWEFTLTILITRRT